MACTVRVDQGLLQGKECTSYNGTKYYSFEGIPYARPPVGRLRFRDPQKPDSWSGVRDATKPGPKCFQMDPYSEKGFEGSEDCLYLNLYTPSLPAEKLEKLPVIFFVHGGRYLVGHGDYYRPDYFIDKDVILVTINYRLHILGFLCLNTPEVPGNASFKDTVMALKWVKSNIKYFNGDQNNVTALGESAGAGTVTSYIVSKMTEGLVHKIIGQSGSVLSDMLFDEDPLSRAEHVAGLLGKETKDVREIYEFLVEESVENLVSAAMTAEMSRAPYVINAFFLPVLEKKFEDVEPFFEEYPLVTLLKNEHRKLPFLSGISSHEGALFLKKDADGNIIYSQDIQRYLPRYFNLEYNSPKSRKLARLLHEFYFKNGRIDESNKESYVNFMSDVVFNRDILMFYEIYSKNSDIYVYNFSYSGNMNTRTMKSIGLKGATHGDLLQYQFFKKSKHEKCDANDMKIIKFLGDAWCNFVKNGVPTWPNQEIKWLPYKRDARFCLNIDNELSLIECPHWSRIKFWLVNMGERSRL